MVKCRLDPYFFPGTALQFAGKRVEMDIIPVDYQGNVALLG